VKRIDSNMMYDGDHAIRAASSLTVVIVGPCASGKSTLAANLQQHGVDARVSGQEHSEIGTLWRRQDPDLVIGLRIDLETLRARRGSTWSASLFDRQLQRLQAAYDAADIVLDTGTLNESEALSAVLTYIRQLIQRD
jgi:deoxyadenosine/deoxycytidine kinase